MASDEVARKKLCRRWGSAYVPTNRHLKVGIAANVGDGTYPINGLRHIPVGDTSGWYIWAGEELSDADDFFLPIHVEHLDEWCPLVKKYLGLAPGWRFLLAPGHDDVWFDASLLSE